VRAGEIQCRCLGAAIDVLDEGGRPLRGEVGELVLTEPLPSMPVRFWDDPDGERYRASYFADFPGVWRHGDWATLTDDGAVIILGRSDSTLNRHGVRIGTAEIYAAVDRLPAIADSLVIGVEQPDGGYWMALFVALEGDGTLDDAARAAIVEAIRTAASPRHVPDEVVQVPAIPRTLTGKKLEAPVKRILLGARAEDVASADALLDPKAIEAFVAYAAARA
jgi:acetoacetyl-CoA synthetase